MGESHPKHAPPAKEPLIRRMEATLERPLSAEEIRLILLAETIRDEMEACDGKNAA